MVEKEKLKEFWMNVPDDIKSELTEFATKSLGISKEDKEEMKKFIEEYYNMFEEQCSHIDDTMARYQLAYGLIMKKYRLTGGGGDVKTRIKPFSVSSIRKVYLKDGTEQLVLDVHGLAKREDMDGAKIAYVTATFWGEDALTVSEEMKPNQEYITSLIWKVDKNTGSKQLTTARNSTLLLEPQEDKKFPSFEEFVNICLQDSTKVIPGLETMLDFEKVAQLGLHSKHPTDIKVLPFVTVIDARLIEKNDRKLGLMEIIDKSILTDREKSLMVWVDESQLVGRGSIIHLIGELRVNPDARTTSFNVHFVYPVKVIKYIPEPTTPPSMPQTEQPKVVVPSKEEGSDENKEEKEEKEIIETEFTEDDFF